MFKSDWSGGVKESSGKTKMGLILMQYLEYVIEAFSVDTLHNPKLILHRFKINWLSGLRD